MHTRESVRARARGAHVDLLFSAAEHARGVFGIVSRADVYVCDGVREKVPRDFVDAWAI